MNWRWNNTVKGDQGWSCGTARFSQGTGSSSSEFGICKIKELKLFQRWKWARKVFTEYAFPLWKISLMKNKNKSTVSNYLILQFLASCWPCEAGRLMHSYTQEVNQAVHWFFWLGLYCPQCHCRQKLWGAIWNDSKNHSDGQPQNYCHERVITVGEKERNTRKK